MCCLGAETVYLLMILSNILIKGITLIQDDKDALLNYDGDGKVWALFGEKALPYNIDRNPDRVPSIAEMTTKALEILSEKENGFFLMVEGSQVDWAAHANDAATMINEYLAFDEARSEERRVGKECRSLWG